MTYHFSAPTPRPRYEGPSELLRLLDEHVAKAEAELRWLLHLDLNEYLYGSAYGPYPPPPVLEGIQALLDAD